MDLAVGQGDLQTDPLQMAVAYSTLANAFMNGGEGAVPTPHLGMAIESPSGGIVQTLSFPPRRRVELQRRQPQSCDGRHPRRHLRVGGHLGGRVVGVGPGPASLSTARPAPPNGAGQVEQAWYMCILPDPKRPIVIAVTVEQGGFGDQAAAPVARLMASEWFHRPLKLVSGSNPDH